MNVIKNKLVTGDYWYVEKNGNVTYSSDPLSSPIPQHDSQEYKYNNFSSSKITPENVDEYTQLIFDNNINLLDNVKEIKNSLEGMIKYYSELKNGLENKNKPLKLNDIC